MSLRGGSEEDELPSAAAGLATGGTLATTSASSCGAEEAFPCSSTSKVIFGEDEGESFVPRVGVGLMLDAASSATGGKTERGRRG